MTRELSRIENTILKPNGIKISNIMADTGSEEYCGHHFLLGGLKVKFRKAKITPKKAGQFVTLWKRNNKQQTEPFSINDDFDLYMIAAERENRSGFFLFPKHILGDKQILTTGDKEGKRGFRVYTAWDLPENKQAVTTKTWQVMYFIDITNAENINNERFNAIINTH